MHGDQDLEFAQNKTVNHSETELVELHLFESITQNEYVYQGMVKLASNPYQELQLDVDGNERTVWIFPLQLVDDAEPVMLDREQIVQLYSKKEKQAKCMTDEKLQQLAKRVAGKPGQRTTYSTQFERSRSYPNMQNGGRMESVNYVNIQHLSSVRTMSHIWKLIT